MGICAVVMAAGEGRRMNSKKCKFVHKTAGRPIISWVKEALFEVGADEQVYIVGPFHDQIRKVLGEDVAFVLQDRQLGTGHAVSKASPFLEGRLGTTLVIRGDTPLITSKTLKNVLDYFKRGKYSAVVISADTNESTGYGKILRDENGDVKKIVQNGNGSNSYFGKPAVRERSGIFEGNSSMYCFDTALLVSALARVSVNKSDSGFCLTDAVNLLIEDKRRVGAYKAPVEETIGVHDKYQLMQVSKLLNRRICKNHMMNGVTITDPDSVWIEASVKIAQDAEILPNTILEGETFIGEDSVIGPDTRISNSYISEESVVFNSIISDSKIKSGCHVGPYAYITRESVIGEHSRIGNSVEVKNSNLGAYTKALNLALIADADFDENVSYGCGCITANFDGNIQTRTKVGENSFIGSNTNLIAPVQVSENTYVAAGSTITDDIPPYAMAIARNRQVIKEEWVLKKNRVRMSQNKS